MKHAFLMILFVIAGSAFSIAQTTVVPTDSKPASTTIAGADYPRVDAERRVIFHFRAPGAQSVSVSLGNIALTKSEDGFWNGTTQPQDPGFHYYTLKIDGVDVADPSSESFFGMGKMASAVEIPEQGVDFYDVKDVPHGAVSSKYYFSNVTKSWRRLFVYTPPGYDNINSKEKFPVVFIQHGGGEDERGWTVQGRTDIILDNLISEGKARPMIVVISNGNVSAGKAGAGYSSAGMAAFKEEMVNNIVPFIDKNYRTLATADNRALCGLSMGGGQSFYTGLESLQCFASVGVFSSGIFGGIKSPNGKTFDAEQEIPGLLSRSQSFNEKLKLFYISVGEQDPRFEYTKTAVKKFQASGLHVEFASFPGNHEWQVWRKSLHDFASRVFK
ncbi:MAG TPA: alpha/beta hydrolase-fold protein [Bacteroidota bacterium]|nr:alpha/beta hydrolase-fold protein [Bacteroidota bacterium]